MGKGTWGRWWGWGVGVGKGVKAEGWVPKSVDWNNNLSASVFFCCRLQAYL